jgi:hypothetical protein
LSSSGDSRFETDRGSFRDRHGRVYKAGNRVIRGLSAEALANFQALEQKAFFKKYLAEGKIIGTHRVAAEDLPTSLVEQTAWAGFVEHKRVPFISYPYEWTFGMLRDAALLHLELLQAAILEGMIIKDSTPYNIQFLACRPTFIDIPSFEPLGAGSVWQGYKQFCEMFLFPLMLGAYKGVHFQPLMRASIDGVDLHTASTIFGKRDWLKKGIFSHVWLQSKLHGRHGQSTANVRSELKSAGFNEQMILANVRKLKKLIGRLSDRNERSEWGEYESFHNYSEEDAKQKEAFVEKHVAALAPERTWDIGCNVGRFSRIAEKYSDQVIAMDVDYLAVEKLYREEKEKPASRISAIVQNVADPSPNWGWRNAERTDLVARSKPDLVLCLALIHHVVITANVPLDEFIDWLPSHPD